MSQSKMPALPELLARYLERQTNAHAGGLGISAPLGEVEPFDAVPVQPVDAAQAWREGLRVLEWYGQEKFCPAGKPPAQWPELVAGLEPSAAVPFCLGNYPQLVRDFHVLAGATDLAALIGTPKLPGALPCHPPEAKSQPFAERLVYAGVLRLGGYLKDCGQLLAELAADASSGAWQPALANERAALAWHQGNTEEAANLWVEQEAIVPVLFNRGMADLFLGRASRSRPHLQKAVNLLPEADAWHHLGRLYLTLAEMEPR